MTTTEPRPDELTAVLAALEQAMPELGELTCHQIFDTLDSYGAVDPAMLREATDRNLEIALTALSQQRVPDPSELGGAAQTATERFQAGVTIDQVLLAFRVSIGQIHARFVDTAMALGVRAEDVVEGSRILWGVSDSFTARAVTTYRHLEVQKSLADAERAAALVGDLVQGKGSDAAARAGMDVRRDHLVLVCSVPEGRDPELVRAELERSASRPGSPALVSLSLGRCLGVAPQRPDAPKGLCVAVGPLMPVDELARSYRLAELAARAAAGRPGVVGLPELTWRLAAGDHGEITEHLRARFIDPCLAQGTFGDELLAALRAWLVHGRSIPQAAQALFVHPNTLRYRLQRFTELTNFDDHDIDDLVGLWWALETRPLPTASRPDTLS